MNHHYAAIAVAVPVLALQVLLLVAFYAVWRDARKKKTGR